MWQEKIAEDLRHLGIQSGDPLLVHASLNAVGKFENRAEILIDTILEVLGPRGTLLMPTLSYRTVTRENPVFDQQSTPSCVGGLTEYFRCRAGTQRSLHPTHSVAGIGDRVEYFLLDHAKDYTPCGPNSPFSKLKETGGKLLFIGCGTQPNTSMHAIEELVIPPYLFADPIHYRLKTEEGEEIEKEYLPHDFKGFEQRYDRLLPLLDTEDYHEGSILAASTIVIKVKPMWEKALSQLHKDPLFFVDRVEGNEM